MSFYSSLVLAANSGVTHPTPEVFRAILFELGLLDPRFREDEFGNLATEVAALFRDAPALAENAWFFCPDSIGLSDSVDVLSSEEAYSGPGWSVKIHGNDYFFPWGLNDLRERVVLSPSLVRLRIVVEERFGGRFIFPPAEEDFLRSQLIDGSGRWAWFASESV